MGKFPIICLATLVGGVESSLFFLTLSAQLRGAPTSTLPEEFLRSSLYGGLRFVKCWLAVCPSLAGARVEHPRRGFFYTGGWSSRFLRHLLKSRSAPKSGHAIWHFRRIKLPAAWSMAPICSKARQSKAPMQSSSVCVALIAGWNFSRSAIRKRLRWKHRFTAN